MLRLILTDEQSKKMSAAIGHVEVVDSQGRTIGELTLAEPVASETKELTPEEMTELSRQMQQSQAEKGPKFKAHQVRDRA